MTLTSQELRDAMKRLNLTHQEAAIRLSAAVGRMVSLKSIRIWAAEGILNKYIDEDLDVAMLEAESSRASPSLRRKNKEPLVRKTFAETYTMRSRFYQTLGQGAKALADTYVFDADLENRAAFKELIWDAVVQSLIEHHGFREDEI